MSDARKGEVCPMLSDMQRRVLTEMVDRGAHLKCALLSYYWKQNIGILTDDYS